MKLPGRLRITGGTRTFSGGGRTTRVFHLPDISARNYVVATKIHTYVYSQVLTIPRNVAGNACCVQ